MARSNDWDDNRPVGGAALKEGASEIRRLSVDVADRMNEITDDFDGDATEVTTLKTVPVEDALVSTGRTKFVPWEVFGVSARKVPTSIGNIQDWGVIDGKLSPISLVDSSVIWQQGLFFPDGTVLTTVNCHFFSGAFNIANSFNVYERLIGGIKALIRGPFSITLASGDGVIDVLGGSNLTIAPDSSYFIEIAFEVSAGNSPSNALYEGYKATYDSPTGVRW